MNNLKQLAQSTSYFQQQKQSQMKSPNNSRQQAAQSNYQSEQQQNANQQLDAKESKTPTRKSQKMSTPSNHLKQSISNKKVTSPTNELSVKRSTNKPKTDINSGRDEPNSARKQQQQQQSQQKLDIVQFQQLQLELQLAKQQQQQLAQQNQDQQKQILQHQGQIGQLTQQLEVTTKTLKDKSDEAEEWRTRSYRIEQELTLLRNLNTNNTSNNNAANSIQQSPNQNEKKLVEINASLMADIDQLKAAYEQNLKENEAMQKQIYNIHNGPLQTQQMQIIQLVEEIEKLNKIIKHQDQVINQTSGGNKDDVTVNKLKDEIDLLNARMQQQQKNVQNYDNLVLQCKQYETTIDEQQKHIKDQEKELEYMRQRNDQLNQLRKQQLQNTDRDREDNQKQQQQKQEEELYSKILILTEENRKLKELENKCRNQALDLERLNAILQERIKDNEVLRLQSVNSQTFQQERVLLEQQNDRLRKLLELKIREQQDMKVELQKAYEEKIKALLAEINKLQSIIQEKNHEYNIDRTVYEKKIIDLQSGLDLKQSELQRTYQEVRRQDILLQKQSNANPQQALINAEANNEMIALKLVLIEKDFEIKRLKAILENRQHEIYRILKPGERHQI